MAVVVFIHQNMPGQFKNICARISQNKNNKIIFITKRKEIQLSNIEKITYELKRKPRRDAHHYVVNLDEQLLYGQAVAGALISLRERGVRPDLIFAHSGWGEALFVKEIFPDSKLVVFSEFYYRSRDSDVSFLQGDAISDDDRCRLASRNFHITNSMMYADLIVTPTLWQKSVHPRLLWDSIVTHHEGVDCQAIRTDRRSEITLPNGWTIRKGDEVITYVSRNLEPYRGFDVFFEAIKVAHRRSPDRRFVIIGGDGISYGKKPEDGLPWRTHLLHRETSTLENVAFLGRVPYAAFLDLLYIAKAHVYLTVPFVLSWSLLEAMALETCVVASRTHPVQEVVSDRHNGLLCAYDADSIAETLDHALSLSDDQRRHIGAMARGTVDQNYDFETASMPRLVAEIKARFDIDLMP